jgi:alkylation response protein AidB-like acyl-CoA dehydrogenase
VNFRLTEQQELIRETARAFFTKEFPPSRLRAVEAEGLAPFLPVYRRMGELGFLGLGAPEEDGGAGGTWLDLALLNEEAGRALIPTVHIASAVLAGQAILGLGTPAQRRAVLPGLFAGERIVAPAYLEGEADRRSALPGTTAVADRGVVVLHGVKRFVEGFELAAALLVTAREGSERAGLYLVERDRAGLRTREWVLQSLERVADVDLAGVAVMADAALPGAWEAWLEALDGAKLALAAFATGAAQAALDLALAYSKVRVQFDRPIGSFQALQHKLADAAMHVTQARMLVQVAAWLRDTRGTAVEETAMAKLVAGRALRRATYTATLTHGGYGFMEEQDVQLYFRRAKGLEHRLGGPAEQHDLIVPETP